jgi:hypothetical protein
MPPTSLFKEVLIPGGGNALSKSYHLLVFQELLQLKRVSSFKVTFLQGYPTSMTFGAEI